MSAPRGLTSRAEPGRVQEQRRPPCPGAPGLHSEAGALDKAPPGNRAIRVLLAPSAQSRLSHATHTSYLAASGGRPGALLTV